MSYQKTKLCKERELKEKAERERDELKNELAALKRTAHWLFSRLSLHLAADQFAGTTLRLERVGEETPWMKEPYIP